MFTTGLLAVGKWFLFVLSFLHAVIVSNGSWNVGKANPNDNAGGTVEGSIKDF